MPVSPTMRRAGLTIVLASTLLAQPSPSGIDFGGTFAWAGGGGGNGGGHGGGNDGGGHGGQANDHGGSGAQADHGVDGGNSSQTRNFSEAATANQLGALNAAHASSTARGHAASNSRVGAIAAYTAALNRAQAISDPIARAAAISRATAVLQAASNKPVTPAVVSGVNSLVGRKTP